MISIALASYNGEKYIREQIDSILTQTIQDFELIVCDDCSTDDTLVILHEYEKKDSRIHVYENDRNLGFKKILRKLFLCVLANTLLFAIRMIFGRLSICSFC